MRSIFYSNSLIIFLAVMATVANAQLLDQHGRDTARVFHSIERALKDPDKVYALELNKQKLKEFPMEILQFKNLNVLDLGNNKLRTVPVQLAELEYLQDLNLMKNKFMEFPPVICAITHLKRLNLSQNSIEEIPREIGQLKELEVLDLWSNELYFFPDEMADMSALRWLDLRTIQINKDEQQRIAEMLPQVNVSFSTPCNCGN